jgi:hypothetical protein
MLERPQIFDSNLSYIPRMKIAVTAMVLAMSVGGVTICADVSASVVGVAAAPALIGWATGGLAPPQPPAPLPDWCTPDNPDPTPPLPRRPRHLAG